MYTVPKFLHHTLFEDNSDVKGMCFKPRAITNKTECVCMLNCFNRVQLFATLWTVACQAFLSMGFLRQEYWNGLPCPPSGNLPNPGIDLRSLIPPAFAGGFFITGATWEAQHMHTPIYKIDS